MATPPETKSKISVGVGQFAVRLRAMLNKINPLAFDKRPSARKQELKLQLLKKLEQKDQAFKAEARYGVRRSIQKRARALMGSLIPSQLPTIMNRKYLDPRRSAANRYNWLDMYKINCKLGLQLWSNQLMLQNKQMTDEKNRNNNKLSNKFWS